MLSFAPGRRRRPFKSVAATSLSRRLGGRLCTLLALLAVSSLVAAQSQSPLKLGEAERLALQAEPGREAFMARSTALKERSVAAGQLLDPQARVGLMNFPIESGGFSTEGMTQVQLGIRQAFPPGQSRALRTQRLLSLAHEMAESAGGRTRDIRSAVRQTWLEAYYWVRAREIVGESRPLFADLAVITRSLYSVGRKDQQDVLRAELELSRLDDRLLDMETRVLAARAALREWVGEAAARPMPAALPLWPEPPELAALEVQLAQHPALKATEAHIQAQQHAVALAREQFKPGWMLDLGYGYREGNLPNGEPRSDFVSLMVSVDVPLFRRNRQSRQLTAALQERRAAEESQTELQRRLLSQLHSAYDRWQSLGRRIALYEELILVQAQDRARASLTAYQSEAGDFSDVLRGYIDEVDARVKHLRLQVERDQTFAVLANLGGISP